ncbi:hypothetical protein COCCADRAFT_92459 [Bipolaris zeicola 26-R-13]|uniref:Uncharacterized protein n=1 Tax=Cochliobolus carbonum (strain 26-R-13) TaxID=930089 RepID=W6YA15_COCC2|nr:uncharacterized protein COCCADRAFT_92459 [Bipolaris zeicola 26-R-13]EUC34813.1 hypothetical protein COCCADRAFT_92459 [Bipolaris zeicola 26-R-13]
MKPHKRSIRDFFSPAPPQTNIHPPAPSQTAPVPPTTSRRITSNGTEVVLNSDSDDDSLPDLDFGVTAPKPNPPKTATITTRYKRTSDNDEDGLRIPTKKARDDKKKFDTLVQTAQKNLETERKIQEHKAVLNKAVEEPVTMRITINEETLGQAVQDDDDDPHKAHRLLQAMQRTNATQMETVFYFFEHDVDTIPMQTKFPINVLPQHRWASNFQRPDTRDQAFMTGFAQHVFRIQELPKELASWMIDQICYNQNEALNCKYLEILEAHHAHLHDLLDSQRLDAIFKSIGTNITQLESNTQLLPQSVPQSEIKTFIPPFLKPITRLLTRAAPWLKTATRSHALYLLCHVCLDTRVTADFDVLYAVQDSMEAIICNFTDNNKLISGVGGPPPQDDVPFLIASQLNTIMPQLLTKITHPVLQRNLTCALPAKCPLTAYLQRHLALSFLLHPTPVSTSLADHTAHNLVLDHVANSPDFFINKSTDYGRLAARLALLDIAIGPGLLAVPYQPLSSSAPSEAGSSPIQAPVPASSEVRQFNEQIDALAQQIKLLGNSIVEAGAVVDIAILETKNSVERMCARLEHASRIGGKKIHDVFGNDEEDSQLRLSKFFKKTHKPSPSAPSRGIFKQNEESDLDLVDAAQT